MSELKAYKMVDEKYCTDCVCVIPSDVYLKSEADKMIAHNKYKRCLAMVKYCHESAMWFEEYGITKSATFMLRWQKRWLKLAEKFKEAK